MAWPTDWAGFGARMQLTLQRLLSTPSFQKMPAENRRPHLRPGPLAGQPRLVIVQHQGQPRIGEQRAGLHASEVVEKVRL